LAGYDPQPAAATVGCTAGEGERDASGVVENVQQAIASVQLQFDAARL
jgi:hypothetical protein